MERFQSLVTLRNRLRRLIGSQSSDALSGQATDRHNEYIRLAHDEVLIARQWQTTQTEYRFEFGIDQLVYNYPTNCGAGNILAIAVWSNGIDGSSGQWIPLRKRPIGLILDTDPIRDYGGDAAAAQRAIPSRYHLKGQIEVWPAPDVPYYGKIDHTVNPELNADSDVTVVDSVATLHLALAKAFADKKNYKLAELNEAKGQARIAYINAWQQAGEIVPLDEEATYDDHGTIVDPLQFVERRPG